MIRVLCSIHAREEPPCYNFALSSTMWTHDVQHIFLANGQGLDIDSLVSMFPVL